MPGTGQASVQAAGWVGAPPESDAPDTEPAELEADCDDEE